MPSNPYRIVFMGTSDFAVPILELLHGNTSYKIVLVISQPDRPSGRNQSVAPTPVKVLAEKLGLPVFQPEKVRSIETLNLLASANPDLAITASYGQILLQKHITIPRFGILNVHASMLPELRGASPIQTAIIQGKSQTGCTIMLTEKGLDTGPILSQTTIDISNSDTAGTLQKKLANLGAELLINTIPQFLTGELHPIPQDHTNASYARQLFSQDGWIDWTRSALEISWQIRGMNPCPGAYTTCGTQRLKIYFAQPHPMDNSPNAPGTLIGCLNGKGFLVQTGNGILLCEEVQPACRKRMRGDNLVQGRMVALGDKLGEHPVFGESPCHE